MTLVIIALWWLLLACSAAPFIGAMLSRMTRDEPPRCQKRPDSEYAAELKRLKPDSEALRFFE